MPEDGALRPASAKPTCLFKLSVLAAKPLTCSSLSSSSSLSRLVRVAKRALLNSSSSMGVTQCTSHCEKACPFGCTIATALGAIATVAECWP